MRIHDRIYMKDVSGEKARLKKISSVLYCHFFTNTEKNEKWKKKTVTFENVDFFFVATLYPLISDQRYCNNMGLNRTSERIRAQIYPALRNNPGTWPLP